MTAVSVRGATPADTVHVAAMVREIAAHEGQSAHVHVDDLSVRPGHRDCGVGRQLRSALARLAAPEQLRIRVPPAWPPAAYQDLW